MTREKMIREFVGGSDDYGVADKRVKPALLALLTDQAALLDASYSKTVEYDLRSGFPDRRSLIGWYQRAIVRTLGNIEDEWSPIDCVDDPTMLAALVNEPPRGVPDMAPETAEAYRRQVEAQIVQPACNRAYKGLRTKAVEYVKTPDSDEQGVNADLDPGEQANIAMRPGFQSLDTQQQRALSRLWGGFEDEDAILDWLHALNSPANGAVPDELSDEVLTDSLAVSRLTGDSEEAATYRETFAATVILPAFVEGVRSMETTELAKTQNDTATTHRMTSTHD